jgi:hypothetical protein
MAVVDPNKTTAQNVSQSASADETAPAIRLTEMFSRCSSQGSWAGDANEYLQAIRKVLEDPSMPLKTEMKYLSDDTVAFTSPVNGNSIVLVRENEIVNLQALLADAKLYSARNAFYEAFPNNRLLNIVTCNRFMYNRASQMAAYINQTLTAQSDDGVKEFNIDSFGTRYNIHIDTEMMNVRQFFDSHSPNPVICGDFGFVASVADSSDNRYNNYQTNTPMFGVTGYVEFIRHEGTGTFTPVVHVTDILSVLASTKVLALALPLIGEIFVTKGLWRQPFSSIGKTEINLGNLLIDEATQKPREIKSEIDYRNMFREYIGNPLLCMDIRAGNATIPGLARVTRPQDSDKFIAEIYDFLKISDQNINFNVGQNIFKEIVGVLETARSTKFSNLMDTRDLTYLNVIAKLKYSPKLDFLLGRTESDPIRRFDAIRELIDGVIPTHSSITTVLSGDFIKYIGSIMASRVNVVMPAFGSAPAIDLTEFVNKSYQPSVNMFGSTGPSSLIGGGYLRF